MLGQKGSEIERPVLVNRKDIKDKRGGDNEIRKKEIKAEEKRRHKKSNDIDSVQ